jgi:hypothetical protein
MLRRVAQIDVAHHLIVTGGCMPNRISWAIAAFVLASTPAGAHHSTAHYDDKQEIELDGSITKFEWANPHAYVYLRAAGPGGQETAWEIEAAPIALLRRLGWSKDSLNAGEHVVIKAHPPKDATQTTALLISVKKADGSVLAMSDLVKAITERGPDTNAAHAGLAGTWATLISETTAKLFSDDDALKNPDLWPLTPRGAAATASFNEDSDLPATECIPYTAPLLMAVPDVKSIEVREDAIVIRGEFDNSARTVLMNEDSHANARPSVQGHSIGRWENRTLVIDTQSFVEHRSGNNWSLPSGMQKHLIERLEPAEDGKSLTYSFELEDPEYLTRVVAGKAEWAYRPDLSYAGEPCNLDNARRFSR